MNNPLLFSPGPASVEKHLRSIAEKQLPNDRAPAFSERTLEILRGLKTTFQTERSVALLTGSGTAAMEAASLNFIGATEKEHLCL